MKLPDADQWREAMEAELNLIAANDTWSIEDLPQGRKPIGCRWVFKIKRDAKGDIEHYKARLVAKGFSQTEGIDYHETFAPVAKFNSIRTLLAIAAQHNLEVHQLDVKTAFLHGDLEEEIYMQQPEGFIQADQKHQVCKLKKSLYGLKQAGRTWYQKLDTYLRQLGFE
jgi:Reverse transcriptase (RNA-dependent DNA polymerase)